MKNSALAASVSVIIPTYNREATLGRSIESVLSQSYRNLEIIVVDDGSEDNTRGLVEGIEDKRLRYIYQENAGACSARNKGIEAAKGEYIAFQDSDDVWLQNKLASQIETIKKTGADIVFCQMKRCQDDDDPIVIPELEQSGFISYYDLKVGISTQTLLMKREVAETIKFDENMPRFQDLEWLLRAVRQYSLFGMKEVLVECYLSEDSISKSDEKLLEGISKIHKKYPRLIREAPAVHAVLKKFVMDEGMARLINDREDYASFLRLGFALSDKLLDRLKYLAVCLGLFRPLYIVRHVFDRRHG